MTNRYYLAYGSNLNIGQMLYRCPGAKIVGIAQIPHHHLLFKGSKTGAYLTIEACKGASVPVAVWQITADDELALDRYEGFPDFYYKKEMTVQNLSIRTKKITTINAFVYVMHEDRKLGVPAKRYVDLCLEGYKTFHFNKEKLNAALELSMEDNYNERS